MRLLIALVLAAVPVCAQVAPPAPVTLELPALKAAPSGEVEVPITAQGGAGLGPMQMLLVHDPSVLKFVAAERGPGLSNALLESKAEPGKVAIAWATGQAITPGVLVKAKFAVTGQPGQRTKLELKSARAWDAKTRLDALVTVKAGEVAVETALPWTAIAIGAAVLLLLAVVLRGGRRKPAA